MNISNIIYVNRDTESEGPCEGSNFFNAFKRFKRNSTEVDACVGDKIKSWMDGIKKKNESQTNIRKENNFFHQTKNTPTDFKNVSIVFKSMLSGIFSKSLVF